MFMLVCYTLHIYTIVFFMVLRPPRSNRTDHSFPTRRSSELKTMLLPAKRLEPAGGNISGGKRDFAACPAYRHQHIVAGAGGVIERTAQHQPREQIGRAHV